MSSTPPMRVRTVVLPGPKIEIAVDGLEVGRAVDVTVLPADTVDTPAVGAANAARRTILEMIEEAPAGLLFKTPEEVDDYLRRERESWDH